MLRFLEQSPNRVKSFVAKSSGGNEFNIGFLSSTENLSFEYIEGHPASLQIANVQPTSSVTTTHEPTGDPLCTAHFVF
jgi:hypothetical protein